MQRKQKSEYSFKNIHIRDRVYEVEGASPRSTPQDRYQHNSML